MFPAGPATFAVIPDLNALHVGCREAEPADRAGFPEWRCHFLFSLFLGHINGAAKPLNHKPAY